MTVRCAVCGMKVRITKEQRLAQHRDSHKTSCPNSGAEAASNERGGRDVI